jgi:electron transfer flavoprotein alpha subunit
VAALLDVAAMSDVTDIKDEETFVRLIYAGNAVCTVKSKDNVKVFTARGTAFEAADAGTSEAPTEEGVHTIFIDSIHAYSVKTYCSCII